MAITEIFNRKLLISSRKRASKKFLSFNFLHKYVAKNIIERIDFTSKKFERILNLGCSGGEISSFLQSLNVVETDICFEMLNYAFQNKLVVDEEYLPFTPESFNLIISNLVLQNVNDVPGTLIQLQKSLHTDGLIFISMIGGVSLFELRDSFLKAELALGVGNSPHIFPFIDIKDMGSLMTRAGFVMNVVDSEIVTVTYKDVFSLMHDLRNMASNNILISRSSSYLGKEFFNKLNEIYFQNYSNSENEIIASFEVITVTGVKSY